MSIAPAPRNRASLSLLTVCGLEELDGLREDRVTHVLSIIDPDLPDPASFERFDPHHRTVLRFNDIIEPQAGMIMPNRSHVKVIGAIGEELEQALDAVRGLQKLENCNDSEDEAVERLLAIRPFAWPNALMIGFADDILGRGGRLSEAVRKLHARQIARKPDLADTFRRLNRSAEVDRALGLAA